MPLVYGSFNHDIDFERRPTVRDTLGRAACHSDYTPCGYDRTLGTNSLSCKLWKYDHITEKLDNGDGNDEA